MEAKSIVCRLNNCKQGCKCSHINFECIPACTYVKLPFKYPNGFTKDNFTEIFFVVATNLEVDSRPILFADSTTSPDNFDLTDNEGGLIILNSILAPCEFCVEGGTYAYEITGTLSEPPPTLTEQQLLLIQTGYICIQQSLRQLIIDCNEVE